MATAEQVAPVGEPRDRVDGRLKVTGKATYAAEAPIQNCVHAVIVQTTAAKGKIADIDTSAAESSPGVLAVLTHKNMPKLSEEAAKVLAEKRPPLSDADIHYAGQHAAVVVATTLNEARYAAGLVKITYNAETPVVHLDDPAAKSEKPKQFFGSPLQFNKGDVQRALGGDGVTKVSAVYHIPIETHNPMEMSATVAQWEGDDKLTVWDATQAVIGCRQ